MALITQIKVGGTTYDVSMKAGQGIAISQTGEISLNLGSGLFFDSKNALCVSGLHAGLGSGLQEEYGVLDVRVYSGIKVYPEGIGVNVGSGLELTPEGTLTLKLDTSKFKFDTYGQLTNA